MRLGTCRFCLGSFAFVSRLPRGPSPCMLIFCITKSTYELLQVDASQGVQAQTISVFHIAQERGLKIIPVLNKVFKGTRCLKLIQLTGDFRLICQRLNLSASLHRCSPPLEQILKTSFRYLQRPDAVSTRSFKLL